MLKKTSTLLALLALFAGSASAQSKEKPATTPKPQPAEQQPAPPRPDSLAQPVNVRLDLTITDQTGAGEPSRKVITMIVADRQNGFIRSKAMVKVPTQAGPAVPISSYTYRDLTINVDARPTLLKPSGEGNVRVDLGLEYQPTGPSGGAPAAAQEPGMTNLNQRISVIVEPGKPLTISQAADPMSDRKISVELKATILR
jgi:hypothetical protein